jgi:hypothetical protein
VSNASKVAEEISHYSRTTTASVIFDGFNGGCRQVNVRFYPVSAEPGPGQKRCAWTDPRDSNSQTGGRIIGSCFTRCWINASRPECSYRSRSALSSANHSAVIARVVDDSSDVLAQHVENDAFALVDHHGEAARVVIRADEVSYQ